MNDREVRDRLREGGYRPLVAREGFTADDLDAYRNGVALYPRRPFPPLTYGFDWVSAGRVPEWCHRDSLESRVVQGKDGAFTVYKVPTSPPDGVKRWHAEQSARANGHVEYVDVRTRRAGGDK